MLVDQMNQEFKNRYLITFTNLYENLYKFFIKLRPAALVIKIISGESGKIFSQSKTVGSLFITRLLNSDGFLIY